MSFVRLVDETRSHTSAFQLGTQAALAASVDVALALGEVTGSKKGFQVGNSTIAVAEVDRWRKLAAIPEVEREQKPSETVAFFVWLVGENKSMHLS